MIEECEKEKHKKKDAVSKAMFVNNYQTLCLIYQMLITIPFMLEKMRLDGIKEEMEVSPFLDYVMWKE